MEMAMVAGAQVLVMFLLLAVGFTCYKIKFFSDEGVAQMNRLLLMIINPMVMLNSFNRAFDINLFADIGAAFLLFFIATAAVGVAAYITVRGKDERARIERFSMCFSNCGFMGIPLVEAALGTEAVVFAAVGVAVFNLTQWTFGRIMLVGAADLRSTLKHIVLSPGIIGVTAGMVLFCSPWTLPSPLAHTVEYMARMNTPLAMLVVGTFIARVDLVHMFKNLRAYRVSAVRLIVTPLMMIPVYLLLNLPDDVVLVNFLLTACPVAAVAAMYPALLGLKGEEGSGYIAVSTLLSVLTIPLMVLILQQFM